MIETMSLSLSLISLTIAVLCMMNVKYVSYFYVKVFRFDPLDVTGPRHLSPRPAKTHFLVIPPNTSLLVKCFLIFRRLHLPRNLLHMHLFVAFIFRSIVKLAFIHLIVGGYTRSMITYSRDKCGNIEITSKSSNLFHVSGGFDSVRNSPTSVDRRSSVVEHCRRCFGTPMPSLKRSSSVRRCFSLRH